MKVRKIIGIIALSVCILHIDVNAEVNSITPDGENGYYLEAPEIVIEHTEEEILRYRLEDANGKVLTGRLDSMMNSVTIQKGVLKDGENVLDTWLEDSDGNVIETSMKQTKYLVDQTAPVYPLTFTRGDVLEIYAEDKVSGVAGIYYALEGQEMQYLKGNNVFFAIPKDYEGKICAYAVDNAGNKGKQCYFEIKNKKQEEVIIPEQPQKEEVKDEEKPSIAISGIPESGISSKAIEISCSISDNEGVTELKGSVIQKLIDETEIVSEINEWKKSENGYRFQRELIEDGIYRIEISGKDSSGNATEINKKFIIDKEPPSISKVSTLEGRRLEEFRWEYAMEEIISDLTSWNSEIFLDGILYKEGQVCRTPGKHVLEITARDLAGNEAKEMTTFYIYEQTTEEKTENRSKAEVQEEVFFVKKEEKKEEYTMTSFNDDDLVEEKSIVPFVIGGVALLGIMGLLVIIIKKCTLKESTQ